MILDKYIIDWDHLLGKGAFGYVYKGEMVVNESEFKEIAVKAIDYAQFNYSKKRHLKSEIDIHKVLSHKNIVKLYDVYDEKKSEKMYIFMEYCDQGTLTIFLEGSPKPDEEVKCSLIKQMMSAAKFLYKNKIIHRDLKPENILIHNKKSPVLKLSDFGLSKVLDDMEQPINQTLLGTPLYMSPEITLGKEYSAKSDVWSMGLIIYYIMLGKTFIKKRSRNELKDMMINTPSFDLQEDFKNDQKLKNLLVGMLGMTEEKRFSWPEVFNSYKIWVGKTAETLKSGESIYDVLVQSRNITFIYNKVILLLSSNMRFGWIKGLSQDGYIFLIQFYIKLFMMDIGRLNELITKNSPLSQYSSRWDSLIKSKPFVQLKNQLEEDRAGLKNLNNQSLNLKKKRKTIELNNLAESIEYSQEESDPYIITQSVVKKEFKVFLQNLRSYDLSELKKEVIYMIIYMNYANDFTNYFHIEKNFGKLNKDYDIEKLYDRIERRMTKDDLVEKLKEDILSEISEIY